MRLKARDRLALTSLGDRIDRLADTHRNIEHATVGVVRDQHARTHRRDEQVQQVRILAKDERVEIETGVQQRDDAAERDGREQQSARRERMQRHQALAEVRQSLRDANREQVVRFLLQRPDHMK